MFLCALKKAGWIRIRIVCKIYNSLGNAFIFKIATLPNHENIGLFHFSRSVVGLFRRGKCFFVYRSQSLEGICMPKYVIESLFQWNRKLSLHWVTRFCGREILRANDLEKLILRLDNYWKCWNSDKSIGIVVRGSVSNNNISYAKAAYLYYLLEIRIPLKSWLSRNFWRKDSSWRIKRIGERGYPCLVPLRMGKASDIVLLTLTLAVGLEYKDRIKFNMRGPKPVACRTASM